MPNHSQKEFLVVKGPQRSALYDLVKGRVYSIPGTFASHLTPYIYSPETEAPAKGPVGPLSFLFLELTHRCNLQCRHCYVSAKAEPSTDQGLNLKDWTEILDSAHGLGCRSVQFTGGEPLLFPDLRPLVLSALSIGYDSVEIFSNGTLLQGDEWRDFPRDKVCFALSLYSCEDNVHDTITGVAGSHKRTCEAFHQLKEMEYLVRIGYILFEENLPHDQATRDFVLELTGDPDQAIPDMVRPSGRGRDCGLQTQHRVNHPRGVSYIEFQPEPGRAFAYKPTCWKGKLAITPEGAVIPCIFSRNFVLGDLRESSLEEIIDSQKAKGLWNITLEDVTVCKYCEYRYACSDCRSIAETTTGDLYAKNPACRYDPNSKDQGTPMKRNTEKPITISPKLIPKQRSGLNIKDLKEEILILSPETKGVHLLNLTSAFILECCDGTRSVEAIVEEIMGTFHMSPDQRDRVSQDVYDILKRFARLGIITG